MTLRALVVCFVLAACGDDSEPQGGTTGDPSASGTVDQESSTGSGSTTGDPPLTTGEPSTSSSSSGTGEPGSSDGSSSSGTPVVCNEVVRGGPSFAATVWPILQDRCDDPLAGGCHQNGGATLGLVLDMEVAYDNLVCAAAMEADLFRVNPGDPATSYWFAKLSGTQVDVGGSGSQMPFGGPYLGKDELATIEDWIAGGASP